MLPKSYFAVPIINFILLLLCCLTVCHAKGSSSSSCFPSSCGKVHNISFPFRLKGDPSNCGDPEYELECQNNQLILSLKSLKFSVQSIDYERYTIRMLYPTLEINNPCWFPLNYTRLDDIWGDGYTNYNPESSDLDVPLTFINCLVPVNSSTYVDITFCTSTNRSTSLNSSGVHNYVVFGNSLTFSDLEASCSIGNVIRIPRLTTTNYSSLSSIHDAIASGIELSWYYPLCSRCRGECTIEDNSLSCSPYKICYEDTPFSDRSFICKLDYYAPFIIFFGVVPVGGILAFRLICGLSFLIPLILSKRKRSNLWSDCEKVQDIVKKGQNSFKPIQYSYSEIKKMTNNFKVKVGIGSCGSTFRGKLRSGPTVAVKMVDRTTSSSEEFLRFVATVGRVDHANVMKLVGFCFEGHKQALVYDLMPNGSIQKYISPKEADSVPLSLENLYRISLGVARGIDYLHQNCDIQAPHLGFKPHNVLLDENLVPKISDFGLAKLCPGLSNAAPEFYYGNIGEAHHRSDVYSFGMMLVWMINTMKKNIHSTANPETQNDPSSSWIHDQVVEGIDMVELRDATAEEKMMIQKLIRVASLCIQMKPADRPSMIEVVKMLEQEEGE